jgi:ABC-type oligopeptide transport system substrate-binding subunit
VGSQLRFGLSFEHLTFNLTHPILKDLAVRQAIALTMRAELLGVDAEGLGDVDRAAAIRHTASANHAVGTGEFQRQRLADVSAAPHRDLRP